MAAAGHRPGRRICPASGPDRRPYPFDGVMAPAPADYVTALAVGLSAGLVGGGLSPEGSPCKWNLAVRFTGTRACTSPGCSTSSARTTRYRARGSRPTPPRPFLGDTIIERNQWTIVLADEPAQAQHMEAAITGISCGFDLLVPARAQPQVVPAEILAVLDTGAYQDATANNFNAMPRPACWSPVARGPDQAARDTRRHHRPRHSPRPGAQDCQPDMSSGQRCLPR
jgi:hypothetical protein